jgi:transcriptional regulator with XRE-family HTH domain
MEVMPNRSTMPVELKNLGKWLSKARLRLGLTQQEVANRAGVSQPRISGIEKGEMLPTLPQLIRLAQALAEPLQWFLNGAVAPGTELPAYAMQLQWLGIVDLFVPNAVVPGAFRPTEQVLTLAVRESQPNPRIVEALPALLAWSRWKPFRLREHSRPRASRASIRLAWLADVALTIHRTTGFPGGCPQLKNIELFVERLSKAKLRLKDDDLGRPGKESTLPPVSKRWKIRYDAPLSAFVERAEQLHFQRQEGRGRLKVSPQHSDE